MSVSPGQVLAALVTVFSCVATPIAGMRMLAQELNSSRFTVRNYRGLEISPSLGIVWVWWVGGLIVAMIVMSVAGGSPAEAVSEWASAWGMGSADAGRHASHLVGVLALASVAVVPAFVLGMIDDVYAGASSKGFRGHLMALRHGHVTTGLLKLVGIGIASLVVGGSLTGSSAGGGFVMGVVLRTLVIAFSANAVNLFDVRPGRALKVYALGAIVVLASLLVFWHRAYGPWLGAAVVFLAAFAGPLMAVWNYDVREQAMLGDAGANPAGALLGVAIAAVWPMWALAVASIVLAAVNLLSERVSFSSVIERNGFLARLDRLGRPAEESEIGHAP